MKNLIIDTVVLRVMSFAHPQGINILLEALDVSSARFPAKVYNRDDESIPLENNDEGLSEFARGLRYAKRQTLAQSKRYQTLLDNARQLEEHFDRGTLVVDRLTVEELDRREILRQRYPIDAISGKRLVWC